MSEHLPITLRTRKFTTNRLLCRRQFILDIHHPSRANVRRSDLVQQLALLYKTETSRVVVFGLRTRFGGGVSSGYALIYDDEGAQRRNEPKYRLIRSGLERRSVGPGRLRKYYKVMANSAMRREKRDKKKARRAQNKNH